MSSSDSDDDKIPKKASVVVCGDAYTIPSGKDLTVGPGLVYRNDTVICTKPGVIRSNEKSVWIDRNNRR